MGNISRLPRISPSDTVSLESRLSQRVRVACDYLELPLKLTDVVLVINDKGLHKRAAVDEFIKYQGTPYCKRMSPTCSYFIMVKRGRVDYKITVKDFRLELLRIKGVLK